MPAYAMWDDLLGMFFWVAAGTGRFWPTGSYRASNSGCPGLSLGFYVGRLSRQRIQSMLVFHVSKFSCGRRGDSVQSYRTPCSCIYIALRAVISHSVQSDRTPCSYIALRAVIWQLYRTPCGYKAVCPVTTSNSQSPQRHHYIKQYSINHYDILWYLPTTYYLLPTTTFTTYHLLFTTY